MTTRSKKPIKTEIGSTDTDTTNFLEIDNNQFFNAQKYFENRNILDNNTKKVFYEKKYTEIWTYSIDKDNQMVLHTFDYIGEYPDITTNYGIQYRNNTRVLVINLSNDKDFKLNFFKHIHKRPRPMTESKKPTEIVFKYIFDYSYSCPGTVSFIILPGKNDKETESIPHQISEIGVVSPGSTMNISLNNVFMSHPGLNNRFSSINNNILLLKLQIKSYLGFRLNMFLDPVHDFTESRLDNTTTHKEFMKIIQTNYSVDTATYITNILYSSMFNELVLLLKETGLYPENDLIDKVNKNWVQIILEIYSFLYSDTTINAEINNDIFNLDGFRDTKIFNNLFKWVLSLNDNGNGITDPDGLVIYERLFKWLEDDSENNFMDLGNNKRHLYVPFFFKNNKFKAMVFYINQGRNKYDLSDRLLKMMSMDKLNISKLSSLSGNIGLYDYFKFFLSKNKGGAIINGTNQITNHLFISDDYLRSKGSWADMMKIILYYTDQTNNPLRFKVYYLKTLADKYDSSGKESLLYKYMLALKQRNIGIASEVLLLYPENNNSETDFGINLTMDFINIGNNIQFKKQLIYYDYHIKGKLTVLNLYKYFDSKKQEKIINTLAVDHAKQMDRMEGIEEEEKVVYEDIMDSSVKSILDNSFFSNQLKVFYNYDPGVYTDTSGDNINYTLSMGALEALDNLLYISAFKTIGDLGKVLTTYYILNNDAVPVNIPTGTPNTQNSILLKDTFNFFGVTDTLGGNMSAIFNSSTLLNNVDNDPLEPYPFQMYSGFGKKSIRNKKGIKSIKR